MTAISKRLLSLALSLIMMFGALSVTSLAAEETQPVNPVGNELLKSLESILSSGLAVAANPKAGLDSSVNVALDLQAGNGTLYLPGQAKESNLRLCWDDTAITLSRNGKTYKSGTAPVAPEGETIRYEVRKGPFSGSLTIRTRKGSAGVAPMYLNLDESKGTVAAMNLDPDHETLCYGTVRVDDLEKDISIKGRGNSSWVFPKKPYNFTIYKNSKYDDKKKAELIPGVKAKKWSLLSNYVDSSLLRNKVAMDLANDMGIGLETRFVDLWMNGDYLGNYLLTPKKDANSPDGGFIIENDHIPATGSDAVDQFDFPNIYVMPGKHNVINIDDIGDDAKAKGVTKASIEKYFKKAWNTVLDYDSEEYQKYFDIDSFAKLYLMIEVSKTYDCYAGNIIMRRRGLSKKDKLVAGPAWDYDVAFGRTLHKFLVGMPEDIQLNAEGWYNDNVGILYNTEEPITIMQGLARHKSFQKQIVKVYREYKWAFDDLSVNVTRQSKVIRDSARMNNALWLTNHPGAEYVVAPNTMQLLGTGKYKLEYEITTTWSSYVRNLREYCTKRVLWLSDQLA